MSTTSVSKPGQQQLATKDFFQQDAVKKKIEEMLGKRSTAFIASVLQIVNSNELLKNVDPMSIYNAACVAAVLDLPLNNALGMAYIVPFGGKAQFQLGYRSYIQLAQRSGQFKTISATPIYDGQIVAENPLTGFEFDFTVKSDKIIGYAAYFELINGFQKTIYKTVEQIEKHAKQYSQTYKKGFGVWKDNFEAMAIKTVIKELLSKYAPLSIEMQKAVITDQTVIKDSETLDVEHIDMTDGKLKEPIELAKEQIIAGLETYDGTDKKIIQAECVKANSEGTFDMAFAEKTAKKMNLTLSF